MSHWVWQCLRDLCTYMFEYEIYCCLQVQECLRMFVFWARKCITVMCAIFCCMGVFNTYQFSHSGQNSFQFTISQFWQPVSQTICSWNKYYWASMKRRHNKLSIDTKFICICNDLVEFEHLETKTKNRSKQCQQNTIKEGKIYIFLMNFFKVG